MQTERRKEPLESEIQGDSDGAVEKAVSDTQLQVLHRQWHVGS